MPIVSSEFTSTAQADGSIAVMVRLFDQDGKDYVYTFPAPGDFNISGKIEIMTTELNEQLAQDEANALMGL